MPIEIRELHIKINVSDSGGASASGGAESEASDPVAQCVEQVMDVIKKQKER
jgi:hypothetical protein